MTSLRPVLELLPSTYAAVDRPRPHGSAGENPAAWRDHWTAALHDSGIDGLELADGGLFCVELTSLRDDAVLRAVLAKKLQATPDWSLDEVGPLNGGLVLSHNGTMLAPGCCADLSNQHEWAEAARATSASWSRVWIGHPWTHVRATGDTLHFAVPADHSDADSLVELLALERHELVSACRQAAEIIRDFGERLLSLIAELEQAAPPTEILRALIPGSGVPA